MECRHHPRCPGCPLLDMPYDAQRAHKRDRLVAAFARYGHLHVKPPAKVAPAAFTEGYRHRLKLPVQISEKHAAIGLYDRDNGRVLDTPDCPVLEPGLRHALSLIVAWMAGRRGIHSLDLRRSDLTGELQAVFACDGGDLTGGAKAARALMDEVKGLVSVAVSRADPEHKRVLGAAPRVIAGEEHITEHIGSTKYRIFPGAFFQVDPRNAAWIHDKVRTYVGDAKRVLDLYAGVGAYALMLAEGRERVVAIEEVPAAARAARAMAPANVEVKQAKVEDALKDAASKFDVVILNPARRGSDPATLKAISRMAPRLVYVSCGPETLARDLDALAAFGMRVVDVSAIDLFPHTPEVETVVHLVRGDALETFNVPGGKAHGPWTSSWSGAQRAPDARARPRPRRHRRRRRTPERAVQADRDGRDPLADPHRPVRADRARARAPGAGSAPGRGAGSTHGAVLRREGRPRPAVRARRGRGQGDGAAARRPRRRADRPGSERTDAEAGRRQAVGGYRVTRYVSTCRSSVYVNVAPLPSAPATVTVNTSASAPIRSSSAVAICPTVASPRKQPAFPAG